MLVVVSEFIEYIISFFPSISKWYYATLRIVKETYQIFLCLFFVVACLGFLGGKNTEQEEIDPLNNKFWSEWYCVVNYRQCAVEQTSRTPKTLYPLNHADLSTVTASCH